VIKTKLVFPRNWTLKDVGAHWDATEDYDDINKTTYSYYRRFVDGYRLLPIRKGKTLDICCRTGNGTGYFAKRMLEGKFVGMDVSKKMGKIASKFLSSEKVDFEFKYYEDYPLPAKDGEFDNIICFETLEHMPDPVRFVNELSRVLKKGGKMVLTMPNITWEPIHWFAAITGIHHSEGPHRFLFHHEAKNMLKKAGFKIIDMDITVSIPYGPKWLTNIGEWFEKMFKWTLMPFVGLRWIYVCEKI